MTATAKRQAKRHPHMAERARKRAAAKRTGGGSAANVVQQVNGYCRDVIDGTIKAAKWEKAAVKRYANDLKRAKKDGSPIYFDQAKAERSIKFIQLLQHTTGRFNGKRFLLEPWQLFIIWNVYGWYRTDDNTRRFRHVYIEIGRKNGKTALAAAISLLEFVFSGEFRPEVYCVATKRSQSILVFEETCRMIRKAEYLKQRISIVESRYTMKGPGGGKYKALGGDGGGDDGLNPSCVIFDELHEFQNKGHLKLWDKMRTGSDARREPIFIVITTAGDKDSLLWKSQRKYAEDVATDDVFDDSLFAFICALEASDDEFDPDNWRKANPGLDTIKKRSGIGELADKGRHDTLAHNQLLRYHCNRIVESLLQFLPLRVWDNGDQPLPTLTGRVCYGGVDLGWRDDLSAFALVFPPANKSDPDGVWFCKVWAFMPSAGRNDLEKLPWSEWKETDSLTITDGNTTDTTAIYDQIAEVRQLYNLKSIGLDGANGREFGTQLVGKGVVVDELSQQAVGYNESMRKLSELCIGSRLHHAGDPVLRSAINHMIGKTSNGLVKPDKEASKGKIDPAVALLMAIRQAISNEHDQQVSRIRIANVG